MTNSSDDKLLAALSHGLTFIAPIIGPLLIFLVKKDSDFVRSHAREALVFQISVTIASIVITIISAIIGFLTFGFGLQVNGQRS